MRLITLCATLVYLTCLSTSFGQTFSHDLDGSTLPWKTELFNTDPDRFTFVVHADLTGGERPGVFFSAMKQVSLLQPDFVISAGDLIEGGGNRADLHAQWDSFDARATLAGVPVFYVGGNHDLSSELERAVWSERNGPHYFHFRYRDVLFLVFDSEDMTSERRQIIATQRAEAVEIYKTEGPEAFAATPYAKSPERSTGAIGKDQAAYFRSVIDRNQDVKHTFLFVHKPVWEADETPFHSIETALEGGDFTVFNGHVHAYAYRERHGQDYVQVATTGGEQFPELGPSEDHVVLVSVSGEGHVSVANLLLDGIRDKRFELPGPDHACVTSPECGGGN